MSHHIILIESFNVLPNADLEIIAILENIKGFDNHSATNDAPSFAPARCQTIISAAYLPPGASFVGKTQEELQFTVSFYKLLFNKEWTVIGEDKKSDGFDDYCPSGSNLHF